MSDTVGDKQAVTDVDHILEGRSLIPWLHGHAPDWRDYVVSEYDYSMTPNRIKLGLEIN